jgi:hypothetical protein
MHGNPSKAKNDADKNINDVSGTIVCTPSAIPFVTND